MAPKLQAFLDLEASLASVVYRKFLSQATEPVYRALDALKDGDYEAAHRFVNEIDLGKAVHASKKNVETLGIEALMLGAARWVKPNKTFVYEKGIPQQLYKVMRAFEANMSSSASEYLRKRLRKTITEYEESKKPVAKAEVAVQKKDWTVDELADALNKSVDSGKALIDAGANLATSRLVTYGFLAQAQIEGKTSYTFSTALDHRVCQICSALEGVTFEVNLGIATLEKVLETEDPASLKYTNPFPDQSSAGVDAFKQMSPEQLAQSGWSFPPLHPSCRCQTIPSGEISTTVVNQTISPLGNVPDVIQPVTVSPAQIAEALGVKIPKPPTVPDGPTPYSLPDRVIAPAAPTTLPDELLHRPTDDVVTVVPVETDSLGFPIPKQVEEEAKPSLFAKPSKDAEKKVTK